VRNLGSALLLTVVLIFQGCASSTHEPTNLETYKQGLRRYVSSGDYGRTVSQVGARVDQWIEQRAASRKVGERLTVVFDLDDTLLSGWPYMLEYDFGWNRGTWQTWVDSARAEPLLPIRDVYRHARRVNIDVIFLTARPEHDRAATLRNLQAIECTDYVQLICKPDGFTSTSAVFKAAERKKLTEEGRVLIAMIGDQDSDLAGGYAERMFKVPNPFYRTP
jgi:predicted secreted acid phosphatase